MRITTLAILLAAFACACESDQAYQQRHQKLSAQGREWLLAKYPPGQTTRAEIRKRLGARPEVAATQPAGGWDARAAPWLRDVVSQSEARTGKSVFYVDIYFGPVGDRMIPGFLQFFFDDDGRIIDADFDPHSI